MHQVRDYRPDIDGLRAVAVLSVILYHVNDALVPGGFIGVDIFFVISGFLISRNILRSLYDGQFSIIEFYRRRVKRIAPAMLVVVCFTYFAAQLLMLPADAERAAESSLWSVLSMANVYFWLYQDTSYFAAANWDYPLLHLWSLGVEEQFYLLWPLLLLLTAGTSRKVIFVGITIIAAASFLLGQMIFSESPKFAYYMLPTRAGELLLGALVAIAVLHNATRRIPAGLVMPLSLIGLISVCASLFLLSEDVVFPGVLAIPPTLGAALIILAGHCRKNAVSRVLALKPLVWVGLLSYSAYLWHWPLLAFYQYARPEVSATAGLIIIVTTFVLAWLTYRYVEEPARRSTAGAIRVFASQYAIPAGAIAVLALTAMKLDGFAFRSDAYVQQLSQARQLAQSAYQYKYVCQEQAISVEDAQDERCVLGAEGSGEPQAILWGDSNAAHYVGMVGAFARTAGFRFRNLELGSCPPVLTDPARFVPAKRVADCRAATRIVRETLDHFDVVIVSASWTFYQDVSDDFLPTFFEMTRELASSGKLVIILGKAPIIKGYDGSCRQKAIGYPFLKCPLVTAAPDPFVQKVNSSLRTFADGTDNVEWFSVTPFLCPERVCAAFNSSGAPMYVDPNHLTMDASWELGRKILQAGMPAPFRLVATWPQMALSVAK